jgi:cell fate regulator YaaT (PSP1 superfamily)
MGCKSCSIAGNGCSCSEKMSVYDWLADMEPRPAFYITEIHFKGDRKEFFRNTEGIDLVTGDPVVVEMPSGHHLGHVSLQGELVRLQMKKKGIKEDDPEIRKIYRKATEKDVDRADQAKLREMPTLFRTRQIISEQKLVMKLSDVEYQADNTKATFYYSADDRVDFRELIKVLAAEFKIRVEMKQISLRQEAGRLGGIGVCGRELCCSTWLNDFKSVSTGAARYQNLSLNPAKLSGQCGRLKCCLNYELDTYVEALKDIPDMERPLLTERGEAHLQKTDIFRKIMWFGFTEDTSWFPLSVERVNEIIQLNKQGKKPFSLEADQVPEKEAETNGVLNKDIAKLGKKLADQERKKSKYRRNKKGNKNWEGKQGLKPGEKQADKPEEKNKKPVESRSGPPQKAPQPPKKRD